MVSRTKKIVAAAAVLVVGLVLAWPLRKSAPGGATTSMRPLVADGAEAPLQKLGPQFSPQAAAPATLASATRGPSEVSTTPVTTPPGDLAAPAIADPPQAPTGLQPTTDGVPPKPETRIHVVHNGDTLERLAKRYLGNESRALEIFDMNRDLLTNPHLLPIGAELRLPSAAAQTDSSSH